jgi:hypothetical protein
MKNPEGWRVVTCEFRVLTEPRLKIDFCGKRTRFSLVYAATDPTHLKSERVLSNVVCCLRSMCLKKRRRVWSRGTQAFVVRSASGSDRDRTGPLTAAVQEANTSSSDRLLHVRQGDRVNHYAIVETSRGGWHILDSTRTFASLPELIAYYCQRRFVCLNSSFVNARFAKLIGDI